MAVSSRRQTRGRTKAASADVWASADMAHALSVVGRLLPDGMRVVIYRPEGETRAAIEATHEGGSTTSHWADDATH